MNEKLKPCPFCDGEAEIYDRLYFSDGDGKLYQIRCKDCISSSSVYYELEEAVEAWNKRIKEEQK